MEESPSLAVSYVLIPDTPLQGALSALIMGLDMGLGPQPPITASVERRSISSLPVRLE